MDERTKEALKKSITHWENIVNGKDYEFCSLCTEFKYCEKCIIFKSTGLQHCEGTPYEELLNHINKEHVPFNPDASLRVYCMECKEIAQREVDFLKSFLPDENNIRHYYLYAKKGEIK